MPVRGDLDEVKTVAGAGRYSAQLQARKQQPEARVDAATFAKKCPKSTWLLQASSSGASPSARRPVEPCIRWPTGILAPTSTVAESRGQGGTEAPEAEPRFQRGRRALLVALSRTRSRASRSTDAAGKRVLSASTETCGATHLMARTAPTGGSSQGGKELEQFFPPAHVMGPDAGRVSVAFRWLRVSFACSIDHLQHLAAPESFGSSRAFRYP